MGLVRTLGARWDAINSAHLATLAEAVGRHGGIVVRTEGDAMFATFAEAGAAAAAAAEAQRALQADDLGVPGGLRVRMGLHSGEAHRAGDDYGGFDVNRAARIAAVAHGGQIVVSGTTAELIADQVPAGTRLDDLGRHSLRDVPRPEHLRQLTVAGLPSEFPPLRTGGPMSGDLPDRLTTFVGRDAELEIIADLTSTTRLVTLTGPGGIGKSSLAIEVARRVAPSYPDGAWFVPLAEVTNPAEVPAAIAHGVGLFDGPERAAADALLSYIADRSMVIVLDNLEQILDAADHVLAVVRASPLSRVIVTSRAPLHVAGEQEVPVKPLGGDARQLFIDRARAVRPGWQPGADGPIVAEICELLDALPLGIELAAARIAMLPPTAIRDRLAGRLPLPGPGVRDAPGRQRTLDAAVGWSHDLLDPRRQRLLRELAVFDGGFDIEQVDVLSAVEGGPSDRLDDLLELADRSLIEAVDEPTGRVRFRMLRTIQTFALERLAAGGDVETVRRRHAEAMIALMDGLLASLNTSRHGAILDRLEPEIPNLRAAQRWAIDAGETELALRLAARLWRYWHAFGLAVEGRRLTEAALAMPGVEDFPGPRAWAASAAGSLAYWQAETAAAHERYDQQLAWATAAGDEEGVADAYFNLGHVLFIERDDETLQAGYMEQVSARFRDLGDERGVARAELGRGFLAIGKGRVEEAGRLLAAQIETFERLDDRQYHAMAVTSLGWVSFSQGDLATATRHAIDGLLESYEMRDVGTTTISLHVGVLVAVMLGRFEDAAAIAGAFEALCERYGVRPPAALTQFIERDDPFQATRDALSAEAYAAAFEEGRRLSLDQAVARVVELMDSAGSAV